MKDDLQLHDAWRSGDRRAGAELFDRYYEPLARFFRNKVEESAGDDLLQSVFLACAEARDGFRGQSSFRAYLFGVAHNQLYKLYRSRKRSPELVDFESVCTGELGVSHGAGLQLREEQRLLLRALRHIPVEYQEVLELHYWEQMETAEIAQVMGSPPGTVKSRLRRGRQLLEEQLRTLAPTREVLESTLGGLERWAVSVRERMPPREGNERP
ncbi:MAG TPA: sigma-70 family RNA polymerase sigma factor [Myxococcaceae bacterium]|nr:sigma-70 family RNA polymerase sigma factor [Myxococcaceae bacterium]